MLQICKKIKGLIKPSQGLCWNKKYNVSICMYLEYHWMLNYNHLAKKKKTAGVSPPGNLTENFFLSMQLCTFNYKVELNVGLVCPWKETGCCIWRHLTIIYQSGVNILGYSQKPSLITGNIIYATLVSE